MVRLTEAMLLLKHLAEALQSLQSCCQTIQHQLWIQNAQRLTSFSWRLASNLMLGAPKSGIYPKCTFPPFQKGRGLCWIVLGPHYVGASEKCSLHEVWWLWHTLDRRRELFNHMPKKMDTPVTWFSWNIVALHCTCRSLVQHHGQTHRGNAIAETPCQSPAEFAILLPNNSIPVVDPKWLKAFIIQLKTCIKPDPGTWQPRHSPKGIWALLDCFGTVLRWSKWELFSSWRPVPTAAPCPCQTEWCRVCSEELSKVKMWTGQIGSCLWHPPKNVGNILPRLCIVCSLVAAKHSYTVCDLLLKLTRPPSLNFWTYIKQEPGTENIDMHPEKQSSNANQKRLVCYLPLMVLFQ